MIKNNNSVNQFLNEVNNKVRLSDFIGQFVNLVEKGSSFVGNCPFHNEKTPSFNVNNDKSLFYCFGCKAGGNIINFISKYKNLRFVQAQIIRLELKLVRLLHLSIHLIVSAILMQILGKTRLAYLASALVDARQIKQL